MRTSRTRARRLAALAAAIGLLLVPLATLAEPTSSQEGAAAPRQEDAGLEQAQPIPTGQIPTSADVVAADLRRIGAMLQPTADVSRIDATLVEREATIVVLLGELDGIDPNRVSARRLEDQRVVACRRAAINASRFAALSDSSCPG